jgi:hypothetical protein
LMSRRTHSPFNHQSRAVGGDSAALHLGEAERSCGRRRGFPCGGERSSLSWIGTGPGCSVASVYRRSGAGLGRRGLARQRLLARACSLLRWP